jgi:hypothetical protein
LSLIEAASLESYSCARLAMVHHTATDAKVERLVSTLVDNPADSPEEVFRRCRAIDELAALGPSASAALPALLRTLVVPVTVDCAIVLRVGAASAIWKVSHHQFDVVLPFLAWALKDDHWGVIDRALSVLTEIGHPAIVPDLVHLAERRLANGPFYFEKFLSDSVEQDSKPLLASVASALGQSAKGRWDGPSYRSEARAILAKLANSGDERVRAAAESASARLE